MPSFLSDTLVTQELYEKWLRRKAQRHVRRDRQRGNKTAIGEKYRTAIHDAVINCGGFDAYSGEKLDWSLISQYDNDESKDKRREYKKRFALLPTVDHIGDGTGSADFKICSWQTNDAKNDLSLDEFLSVCRVILEWHGYTVKKNR